MALGNYADVLLRDPQLWPTLWRTLEYLVFGLGLQVGLGLGLALLLNREFPAKRLAQTVLIFPVLTTPVVVAMLWKYLFDLQTGLINQVLGLVGIERAPQPFSVGAAEIPPRRQHRRRRTSGTPDSGKSVWIVHGRDTRTRDEMAGFLRAIGLIPLEYNQAIRQTRTGSPHPSTVLERAFATARAVIVLLTPDDEARLRAPLRRASDPLYETTLTPQARPNVLFEAGEAFGINRRGTILVQVGSLRPFSNVAGLHLVHLRDDAACRQEIATKLEAAGCQVDRSGQDWLRAGNFAAVLPRERRRQRR